MQIARQYKHLGFEHYPQSNIETRRTRKTPHRLPPVQGNVCVCRISSIDGKPRKNSQLMEPLFLRTARKAKPKPPRNNTIQFTPPAAQQRKHKLSIDLSAGCGSVHSKLPPYGCRQHLRTTLQVKHDKDNPKNEGTLLRCSTSPPFLPSRSLQSREPTAARRTRFVVHTGQVSTIHSKRSTLENGATHIREFRARRAELSLPWVEGASLRSREFAQNAS